MRTNRLRTVGVAVLLGLASSPSLLAAEATLPGTDATAAELVAAALRSELDGPSPARAELLKEAIQRDPNFAPARWHAGFVKFDDQWLTLDQVARRVADDKQLTEYRKRRDALVDTADHHRELARWCHKNRLLDEERVHWAKVLEFNAQDAEALSALGLQLYEGRLLTREQIVAAKKQAGEAREAMRHWQPLANKWRKAIDAERGKDTAAALEAIDKLDDPAAIPALEAAFAENKQSQRNDDANRLLIETVGRMPFPAATEVLLRRALMPDSEKIRAAAADELKKRPMFAYVPQLIALLPGKLKTKFHIYVLPGGMVLHEHEVLFEGRQADYSFAYESVVNPTDALTAMLVTPRAVNQELRGAALVETQAQAASARLEWMRGRVQFALERATGFSNVNDPELWKKQYNEYNGWQTSMPEKRRYQVASYYKAAQFALPTALERTETSLFRDPTIHNSCFAAGTLVATDSGMAPIERINTGDRVLAQNVLTGELDFRPVQERTLRVTSQAWRVVADGKSVVASPGHPFWVVGEGWRTTKNLRTGDRLHGLNGAAIVSAIEEVRPMEVYNLVVSDWHCYFAGEGRLLVYDNSPLRMPSTVVPGMKPQVASDSP